MPANTTSDRSNGLSRHLIDYGFEFCPEVIASAGGRLGSAMWRAAKSSILRPVRCAPTLGHNHPEIVAAIEKACREAFAPL